MKRLLPIGFAVCLWLGLAWPQETLGSGELVGVAFDDHGCYGNGPTNATFTSTSAKYVFAGSCLLTHTRLNLDVAAPWTGVGTYDPSTGRTQENISVPPPAINQPSRPYGTFQAVMHCSADPWLNPTIRCDSVVASADAPLDHMAPNTMGWKQPYPLAPFITGVAQQIERPFTSTLTQDAVNSLVAQHRIALAVQHAGGEIHNAMPDQIQLGRPLVPSILYPVNGQNFFAQAPVPIMLAPPPGVPVTSYMVDMESNGHFLCNIPVGAAEAQSKLGYTGFGAGKPPCFLTVPGPYRMRVQVFSPVQSGWSDWVQFTVTSPKIPPFILHRGIEGEEPGDSKPSPGAPEPKSGAHQ